jgi:hypothetical protein
MWVVALWAASAAGQTALWGRFEAEFSATQAEPDAQVSVQFSGPDGSEHVVDAFWDGGLVWRVRFMPTVVGTWSYVTRCEPTTTGLDGMRGEFACVENAGGTRFDAHGPVVIGSDRRRLAHADGTPFLWLADTAWNGALLSSTADWDEYLAARAAQGFTAIQCVTTQWRAAYANAEGQVAYKGREPIAIQPEFFRRLDARLAAVNAHGLLAAPVLLWALGDAEHTPGKLPASEAIKLARYLKARYGAHHVAWILGGDENYGGDRAAFWKQVGRATFTPPTSAMATLHPQGMQWHFDAFRDEPWLNALIYQSGHGDDANTLRWIHSGPPAQKWRDDPPRPVINSEPPYEDHVAYQSRQPLSAEKVRRAIYWSLLNAPTAGVTFGVHGIWSWQETPGVPLNHPGSGEAKTWRDALHLPASQQMTHVAELLRLLPWERLEPAPQLLKGQPFADDPARYVAAAKASTGNAAVFYLPQGVTRIELAPAELPPSATARWFDPRTGELMPAELDAQSQATTPDAQDWALILLADGEESRP